MSDPKVIVNVNTNPIDVTVHCGTPSVVNVTDKGVGVTQAVQNNPQVTVLVGLKPTVSIKYGITHTYDPAGLLALLLNGITEAHLDAVLISRLDDVDTSVADLINQTSLLSADLDIAEASLAVTQEDIIANVLAIAATDGNLDIAVSNITQNATDIVSAVTRISSSEDNITAAQSTIIQQANSIASLVTDLSTSDTLIIQNTDAITVQATLLNQTNNTLDQATLDITAQGVTIGVMSTNLDDATQSIGSTMEMLTSQYAVTIQQDGLGNSVVTGLKLILYPDWDLNTISYIVDDYVWYENSSWKCILAHDSDDTNYPQVDAPGSTYWVEEAEGIHTSFSILADEFKIQNAAGTAVSTPFVITGTKAQFNTDVEFSGINKTLISGGYINTDLVNANSIKAGSVTADEITAHTITADKIAANTLTAAEIAAGTITATELDTDSITTDKLVAQSITTDKINDNAVTVARAASATNKQIIYTGYVIVLTAPSIDVDGSGVFITASLAVIGDVGFGGTFTAYLYRGSTQIYSLGVLTNQSTIPTVVPLIFKDSPAAGTYTYYIKMVKNSGNVAASTRSIMLLNPKK